MDEITKLGAADEPPRDSTRADEAEQWAEQRRLGRLAWRVEVLAIDWQLVCSLGRAIDEIWQQEGIGQELHAGRDGQHRARGPAGPAVGQEARKARSIGEQQVEDGL